MMAIAGVSVAKHWYDFVGEPEPVEDGMLQNPIMEDIASVLRVYFKQQADSVLVSGPTFILYDIHNPNARIAPDCYVVLDVDAQAIVTHNSYRIWEWGKPPDFVLEVASESTASNDAARKRDIYASIGVLEYWRFDPSGGDLYGEPLIGERLVDGVYERYELHIEPNGDVWSHSEVLNLDFYWRGNRFWVKDAETGEWLNFLEAELEAHEVTRASLESTRTAYQQEIEAARAAHQQELEAHEVTRVAHQQEREARAAAEAQVEQLQAELERLRQEQPKSDAE